MSFEVDEEILQDFLVEAGEILEQLQEQLVDLENNPEDSDLLNAIFRGYHTVKGGAGFLSLTELVDVCHGAENVFDVMRNGQRTLTPELMDVILQATDVVVAMFESVQAREPLEPAPAELIDILHKLSTPETEGEEIFSNDAEAASEAPAEAQAPVEAEVEEVVIEDAPSAAESQEQSEDASAIDEITEDEFEALLDELHGDKAPGQEQAGGDEVKATESPESSASAGGGDDDITDDEFEALLDELHGKGSFKANEEPKVEAKENVSDDEITDEEFEALLDNLHGKGQGPKAPEATETTNEQKSTSKEEKASADADAVDKNKVNDDAKKPEPAVPAPAAKTPAPKPETKAPAKAPAKKADSKPAPAQSETTVRVDTKRLDQIMNMVGELVLVRNRLLSLGINLNDESMSKAIANLDVVTGDLQGAVMKTRMQPIKKVFGRFPRVVRDLARSLKKEITLVLEGEETDLDKNLVDSLRSVK